MLKREQLHDYQTLLADTTTAQRKLACWYPLGYGKTAGSLTAIVDLIDGFAINKTLIIAPLRVANSVWHREAAKWEHTKHLTFSIATGDVKKRNAAICKEADVYVINRENIPWLVEQSGFEWVWDFVIIDEASSFKSHSSKRFKALKKVLPKIEYLLELTATPRSNSDMDLWPQMYLLDQGKSLGKNITAYRTRYFTQDYMGFNWVIRKGADRDIWERIKHLVITQKNKFDIPTTYTERVAELPKGLMTLYKQFKKEFVFALEEDDDPLVALNAAALSQKLAQFSNGFLYREDAEPQRLHHLKLDMLEELLEETDSPLLVFYSFKEDLAMLQERFPKARVFDREGAIIDEWREGKVRILLAHPASVGHGVDGLQDGGNVVVWYGLPWSLELYEQANGRIARQGQKEHVTIIHLVIEGCHDYVILKALTSKAKDQNEMLAFMRDYYLNGLDTEAP